MLKACGGVGGTGYQILVKLLNSGSDWRYRRAGTRQALWYRYSVPLATTTLAMLTLSQQC